jgi:glutathione S-transferase
VENVLYTFRRCPYAMRARLALALAGVRYQRVEVSLKAKPEALLRVSPKGTVPVLVLEDGTVLEESLDIMHWALRPTLSEEETALIAENDGAFKRDLDRYKYPHRYGHDAEQALLHRGSGVAWLAQLDSMLSARAYLFGSTRGFADLAIMPFVRQFARHDETWFQAQPLLPLRAWLDGLVNSALFVSVMAS